MAVQSRTEHSIRNTTVALVTQIVGVVLSFVTRTIFIKKLNVDYLGINGLFSNILTMLSLAEMGVGTAIIYAMYKPLAEKNEKKISALMNLYERLYRIIGLVVAGIGLALVPFLNVFIRQRPAIPYLEGVYLLYLSNTVLSYFFTFKRSIVIADQQGYLSNLNTTNFLILQNIAQIILLLVTGNYYLFLITQIVCTVMSNVVISRKVDRMYPYLKKYKNETLTKSDKQSIWKSVAGMMSSKLGAAVVNGTDNLLISAFVGVYSVGLYSNYKLIVNTVKTLFVQCVSSVTASVGNLNATESRQKSSEIFFKINFMNYILAYFGSLYIYFLINPFVALWLGEKYILSMKVVLVLILDFYVIQMRQAPQIYINTYGLFWQIRWKSILEAGINLAASLLFVAYFKWGVFGVLLGTLVSNITTNLWWEPYVVFKFGLCMSFSRYILLYLKNLVFLIGNVAIISMVLSTIEYGGIVMFLCKGTIVTLIAGGTFVTVNYKKLEFKYCINIMKRFICKH
ncbi:MAG: lipopolysaccharide biosynthesis protein [Clostridium sp.]|nr:lipopolysaccharide biosynthesis protein [Clostridium sp.]